MLGTAAAFLSVLLGHIVRSPYPLRMGHLRLRIRSAVRIVVQQVLRGQRRGRHRQHGRAGQKVRKHLLNVIFGTSCQMILQGSAYDTIAWALWLQM